MRVLVLLLVARSAAADPLVFEPMQGPFKSLTAYCDDYAKANDLDVGECEAKGERTTISFTENALEHWQVAIRERAGWFVYDAPLCEGRGCTNEPTQIRAGAVVEFSFAHEESGRTASYSGHESGTEMVICRKRTCANAAIPIRADVEGADDVGSIRATVRLAVSATGKAIDIRVKQLSIRGDIVEADGWRERVAALVGHHAW